MKDFSDRNPVNIRSIFIGGLVILLAGLITIMVLFSGGSSIDADTPVYDNGSLKTTFSYHGPQPRDVWIQYSIFRQTGILSSTGVGEAQSFAMTFYTGNTLAACPVTLTPGEYKIFIYVLDREDDRAGRLAGFIRTITVE